MHLNGFNCQIYGAEKCCHIIITGKSTYYGDVLHIRLTH